MQMMLLDWTMNGNELRNVLTEKTDEWCVGEKSGNEKVGKMWCC